MDGDENQSGGVFGNYAYWQLGRWSAQRAHRQQNLIAKLTGVGPVSVREYNQQVQVAKDWRRECLRLQQINANLVAHLNASNKYAAELKTWGRAVDEHRNRLQEGYDGQMQLTLTYLKQRDRLRDEVDRLTGNL